MYPGLCPTRRILLSSKARVVRLDDGRHCHDPLDAAFATLHGLRNVVLEKRVRGPALQHDRNLVHVGSLELTVGVAGGEERLKRFQELADALGEPEALILVAGALSSFILGAGALFWGEGPEACILGARGPLF